MALIPPLDWYDEREHRRRLGDAIRGVIDGHTNAAGTVTLTASTVTTTVTDRRAGTDSIIALMPTTANAAGMLTRLYVSERTEGAFTFTHAATTSSDMTYDYCVLATGREG